MHRRVAVPDIDMIVTHYNNHTGPRIFLLEESGAGNCRVGFAKDGQNGD